MSTKVYNLLNSIVQSTDLLQCGQELIEFSEIVYKEKNRTTIVKHFYEQLYLWAFSHLMTEKRFEKKFFICNKLNSVKTFIGIRIPQKKSTVKTINEIKSFGEYILENYKKPVGKSISEKSLNDILEYMDKEYLFSKKVFSNNKAGFIILNNTHKIFNSECLIATHNNDITKYFFLYHMNKKDEISPEAVLFHELGHALHAQLFGNINYIPDNIIDILQDICIPKIKQLDIKLQRELFADVLSIGLMFKTPFEKYDIFNEIDIEGKMLLKKLVIKLLENIK